MPSAINEQTQYVDVGGAPLVGGKIYIGTQNQDPKVNPISIFSDRALTVSLSNPQTLDANGRSTNKIWIPDRYSLKIENLAGSQVYQELDNGSDVSGGITSLSNISGGNTIVATAATTITAYVDKEIYVFKTAQINTGAVTLDIDGVGAKSIVKNFNKSLLDGDFAANQSVAVMFNSTNDNFDLINQKATSVTFYEGSAVASAATADIWASDGNTIHLTGTTTITSFGTAPNVGAWARVVVDAALILTNGANLILQGGVNYTTAAGDVLFVYADTTTIARVVIFPASGLAVVDNPVAIQTVNTQTGAVSTTTTQIPDDDTIPQSGEGAEVLTLEITPKNSSNILYIDCVLHLSPSTTGIVGAALFQDSTAGALAAMQSGGNAAGGVNCIKFRHKMVAGTTSATTFKLRGGMGDAGTITFNGKSSARRYGGVLATSITITEYAA